MASRVKEDEKNEKIIRGLLKLPENRRCINCDSLGPQYVCTNFWTFVCTNCSGIHREFTHRVKSVSMAKFTSQEVSALQRGGNQRAKEIYLKEWDMQRNSLPDRSNVDRLRDFIKHVYVDRRYTGERNFDKPPRVKMGDKEDLSENKRIDTYQVGSRSPPYEDTNERRYSERSSPGGRSDDKNFRYSYDERRSPGNDQERWQHGDYQRSPARPEIINDWRREGNGRKSEERRMSDGDLKFEGRSPEHPKDLDASSPPVVRPVREILGENVSPLRISEPPKANGGRTSDVSAHTQRTASSSSLGSTDGHPVEPKMENLGSLIDFDADPEPPTAAVPQFQQTTITRSVTQPVSSIKDNNWASFDLAPEAKVPQTPSNVNTLDSVLSQLSVPVSVAGQTSGIQIPSGAGISVAAHAANMTVSAISGDSPVAPVGHSPMLPFSNGAPPAAAPVSSFSMFPSGVVSAAAPGSTPVSPISGNSFVKVSDAGQWPSMQHQQPSLFPGSGTHSTAQQFTPPTNGVSSNQSWNFSLAPNAQGYLNSLATQAPQSVSTPTPEVPTGVVPQPTPVDVKSNGRKALPEDLFAATHSSFPVPVPGWHIAQPRGMGFPMQYNTATPIPTFPESSKSTNPFDLNSEPPQVQAPTFPTMASLQAVLPNVQPYPGLLRTSSLGTPSAAWMPPHASSYTSGMPSQTPSYALAMPPRAYMGQQVPSNMPPSGYLGVGGFGNEGAAYGSLNPDQQLAGRYSAPATPNPLSSVGGNPFG